MKLVINKNKAKDLGVSTKAIGETLETLYGGKKITTFNKLGKEYPIVVQQYLSCLLYTSPSPRDDELSRMPSSA